MKYNSFDLIHNKMNASNKNNNSYYESFLNGVKFKKSLKLNKKSFKISKNKINNNKFVLKRQFNKKCC